MPVWTPPNGEWKAIVNPSTSHVARSGQCATATPPAIGTGTELATLDYDRIDDGDDIYLDIDVATTNYYPYLMWEWVVPLAGAARSFNRLIFSHWCWGYGYRTNMFATQYGCKLYVWNAASAVWELIGSSTASSKDQLAHTVNTDWTTALNYVVSGTGRLHACLIGTYPKLLGYVNRLRVDQTVAFFKSPDAGMLR